MSFKANPQGPSQPGGFFYGPYGGPRTNASQNNLQDKANYVFTKSRSDNLDLPLPSLSIKQPDSLSKGRFEPLNDAILDGNANLLEQIGKRVQAILRDGRILIGELASVDQFSNLVLRDAVERIVVGKQFGDIVRGIIIIRGDNLILIGEVEGERESAMERVLEQVPVNEILLAHKIKQDADNAKQLKYLDALKQRGVAFPRPLEDEF